MNRFFDREPGDLRRAAEEREADEDARAAEFDPYDQECWEAENGK